MRTAEQSKRLKTIVVTVLFLILLIAGYFSLQIYNTYFKGNVASNTAYIFVRTGASYDQFISELSTNHTLNDLKSFESAASKMNLISTLKAGRYQVKKGMNNRTIINMIKSGNQSAVKLKIQNIRKKSDFEAYLAKYLENDSVQFSNVLDSISLLEKHGFNKENSYTMYIPNTYEVYWNITPEEFFNKMYDEYEKFWNSKRKEKAAALNLNPQQVTILASIVDAEALYDKEMPIIAGLYLNRLRKGIRMQADPTVIFANNDFTVKRVTNALLSINSPYNTYKVAGLPPGPIMMPSINAIDAVLNRQENEYIYMCAKEDFSGYHNFAVTQAEHEANAKKYRDALNKRKIFK